MKTKIGIFLLIAVIGSFSVFAQNTVYVSARGTASNSGTSESQPVDFITAMGKIRAGTANKMVVIGTLDYRQQPSLGGGAIFYVSAGSANLDILITGKTGARAEERAVLSGKGSGCGVVVVNGSNAKVRFENIEISGGEGEFGTGLSVKESSVTLGPGAVVRGNSAEGIFVEEYGTCTIDGGDVNNNNNSGVYVYSGLLNLKNGSIRDNTTAEAGGGVFIDEYGLFDMSGGSISGNRTGTAGSYLGGGVLIYDWGEFTMTGGSITNNRASGKGGGVAVLWDSCFDQIGGTISNNTAPQDANIYRASSAPSQSQSLLT